MSKVLGVIGSMRQHSHTAWLVDETLKAAEKAGAEVRLFDMRKEDVPIFNPDEGRHHASVRKARAMILWSDAILLGSPDYHGSMSGAIKNFLDFYWREFAGRVFGYVCASHEKGLTVMDQMRTAIRQCYGWSMPYGVASNPDKDMDAEGNLLKDSLSKRLEDYGYDLARYGEAIHSQFQRDLKTRDLPGFAGHYRD